MVDPEAAQLVLSKFSSSTLVSWDACVRHSIPWPTVEGEGGWLVSGSKKADFMAGGCGHVCVGGRPGHGQCGGSSIVPCGVVAVAECPAVRW